MILAFDIGTTTVKGARFSGAGECELLASEPVAMRDGDDPLVHEVEAGDWLKALASIAARLLADGARPEAVAVSGNGPCLLPVAADGRPLHAALSWMDRRAAAEAAEAGAAAGILVDAGSFLPKALWFARRRPEIYARTAAFMSCPEFVVRALTGESMTIVPAGYERHYGEAPAIAALGLDPAKFPRFAKPGALAGAVGAAGEAATGVPRGTAVVAVGPDYLAALLGTATTAPGRACDRAGTSEGINLCATAPAADRRLISVPHIVPPYANVSGSITASGRALDWWKAAGGRSGESYEELFAGIGRSPPGAGKLLFLPYLAGERAPIWDPRARGAFVGLTLSHGRDDLARAVAESTAFAMRDVIEVMEEAGAGVGDLRVTGGPARSAAWNQIKADVTGRPILLPRFGEAELLGGLCFALAALGRYAAPAEAAEELVEMAGAFEPDRGAGPLYGELFAAYREAYEALRPVFERLGDAGRAKGRER